MSGRYILVEVEDKADLPHLLGKLGRKPKRHRVVGIFARPDRFCSCPTPTGYHKDEVVRGAKLGWWVHVVCRRPIMGHHQPENLLPIEDVMLPDTEIMSRASTISIFQLHTENAKR